LLLIVVSPRAFEGSDIAFNALALGFVGVGTLLTLRKPDNFVGWSLSLFALTSLFSAALMQYGRFAISRSPELPLAGLAGALDGAVGDWMSPIFFAYIFLFFPNGKLPSPRWRLFLVATILVHGVGFVTTLLRSGIGLRVAAENPIGIPGSYELFNSIRDIASAVFTPLAMLLFVALFVRRRRASAIEMQQLKWLFFTAGLIAFTFIVIAVQEVTGSDWGDHYGEYIWFGLLVLLLASIAIAVLKYRLYDIDVVINKTIVFGSLAAFITGIYVAIVVGIGTLLGSQDEPNLALSIAATAIVAIAFSPVKERTQHLANRLVYGHRLSPYEVLTDLSRAVATAPTPQDVLDGVAHAATLGVKALGATVTLDLHDGSQVTHVHPEDLAEIGPQRRESFEVFHESERLGNIEVHKRSNDPLTPQDRELLDDLSRQAGLALHNARLALELQARLDEIERQADELQSSRARIVSAADDSRRRLERDISEGPRRDLIAMQQELESVCSIVDNDPETAAARLKSLTEKANFTLDNLRELARGIYPPLLADKGIVAALESHMRKHDLDVTIEADDPTRAARFDHSVETIAYFCCIEAVGNAASAGTLKLTATDRRLGLELAPVSLENSMRLSILDRVEAGGGVFEEVPDGAGSRLRIDFLAPTLETVT
jgi:signal transduction histidine kinase